MKWYGISLLGFMALAGCTTEQAPVASEAPHAQVAASVGEPVWPASAPEIHARSAIMIDARTGRTLYQKYADTRTQVASTQKLVTALVILSAGNLEGYVTIARSDEQVEPTKLGMRPGQSYTRMNLLGAMLVHSENDAAAALARDHSGSFSAFAAEMNRMARSVGANDSYFVNPHGLPAPQYSTARDMARIAFRAYREPVLRHFVAQPYYTFDFTDGRVTTIESTNKLLGHSPICNGMKTGYTEAAGKCLVSSGSLGGRDVILVQLGSRVSYIFDDAERMMEWGLQSASQ